MTELLELMGQNAFLGKLSDKFFLRLLVDMLATFVMVRLVYYRFYKKTELFLTFFGFNMVIFLISYLLNRVDMTMGAAFGLFAVFSMLRFRTEGINTKDMTYLFLVIAMGLVTAVSKGSWDELGVINLIIIVTTVLLDGNILTKKEVFHQIDYDNLENIKPENREYLLEDLKLRTGISVHRVDIISIDMLRDSARIHAFYYA
ncbi:DUF4956 domain-containing protein [Jiulongibacter sediminis]|uniref:DUF4956 domain-containing protein n=1 Tax=Jiulongibacter sediminis TaxID=1605367 RepID=UPI0006DCD97C|nr:DUF4956 domain-containing protein [Jiulongibacter sediminis]